MLIYIEISSMCLNSVVKIQLIKIWFLSYSASCCAFLQTEFCFPFWQDFTKENRFCDRTLKKLAKYWQIWVHLFSKQQLHHWLRLEDLKSRVCSFATLILSKHKGTTATTFSHCNKKWQYPTYNHSSNWQGAEHKDIYFHNLQEKNHTLKVKCCVWWSTVPFKALKYEEINMTVWHPCVYTDDCCLQIFPITFRLSLPTSWVVSGTSYSKVIIFSSFSMYLCQFTCISCSEKTG